MAVAHNVDPRFDAPALVAFAEALLARAGVARPIARDVAEVLVDADLMGHTTHGLQLLAPYLAELDKGTMVREGEPVVLHKRAATQSWDARRLPGPHVVRRAFDAASTMARDAGSGTVVIRRSHHIACLAAYMPAITARGQMALLYCSDPNTCSVAPFGGITPVFTPNPFAAGIPTSGDPILLDISASYTTNGLTGRLYEAGEHLPHAWLQDEQGKATDDPAVLFGGRKGTLLPLGGLDAGHKGYALALLVEALTGGLAAHGRADPKEGWGATVMVQVLEPEAFGGVAGMERQMDTVVAACHAATPREGVSRVRLPGERALKLMREQRDGGVALHPGIMPAIAPWAQKLGVPVPPPRH